MGIDTKTIKKIAYAGYVLFFLGFVAVAAAAPLLAFEDEGAAKIIYDAYSPFCHQKLSRSFCIFDDAGISVADCTPQTGVFMPDDNRLIKAAAGGRTGYKIAICSRDVGLYGMMVAAALVYPFFRKWDSREMPPAIYFILALVPIAIDGTLQILGSFGLFGIAYESTNLIRFLSGGLAGAAVSFYLIPLMMNLIDKS